MSTAYVAPRERRSGIGATERTGSGQRIAMTRSISGARRKSGLTVVDGDAALSARTNLASVVHISNAPSACRRRQVLRAEDPCVRRRPHLRVNSVEDSGVVSAVELASVVSQAVRTGVAQLRMRHLLSVGAFIASVTIAAQVGLALQPAPYSGPTVEHAVRSGESVWSLAASVDTQRPLEDVVVDIERLNGISGALSVGQHLTLPTR